MDDIYRDFEKAFDTIPLKILYRSRYFYVNCTGMPVRGKVLKSVDDFLNNKRQSVKGESTKLRVDFPKEMSLNHFHLFISLTTSHSLMK